MCKFSIIKLFLVLFFIMSFSLPFKTFSQWSQGIKLSTNSIAATLNEDAGPCIAVNENNIHVVWSDKTDKGYVVFYKISLDNGVTWSNEIPVTDPNGKATMPVISVYKTNIHIVWMDTVKGIRASLYKNSLDNGVTWSKSYVLDSNTKFWPGIASFENNLYVTLNKAFSPTNTEVYLIKSTNNGNTWDSESLISNAEGRSEDPAIAVDGDNIHLSWNDNRNNNIMEIYYRNSSDGGITWGKETALTKSRSYTSMVCVNGNFIDIPFGNMNSGSFETYMVESKDNGANFGEMKQLSSDSTNQLYPYLVRDSNNLHLTYYQLNSGSWYRNSTDGGETWTKPLKIGSGGQAFIVLSGCVLHIIYPKNGAIYYLRNPTGNCSNLSNINNSNIQLKTNIFPNPAKNYLKINNSNIINISKISIFNLLGELIYEDDNADNFIKNDYQIDIDNYLSGNYYCSIYYEDKIEFQKITIIK